MTYCQTPIKFEEDHCKLSLQQGLFFVLNVCVSVHTVRGETHVTHDPLNPYGLPCIVTVAVPAHTFDFIREKIIISPFT